MILQNPPLSFEIIFELDRILLKMIYMLDESFARQGTSLVSQFVQVNMCLKRFSKFIKVDYDVREQRSL